MSLDTSSEKPTTEVEKSGERERVDDRHFVARGAPRRELNDLDQTSLDALKLFITLVLLTAAMAVLVHWLF